MHITTIIPYGYNKALGQAYNREIEKIDTEWFLILDSDVLILSKYWYQSMEKAIEKFGKKVGWFSGLTNRTGCHWQRIDEYMKVEKNDDIRYHQKLARVIYDRFKDTYSEPNDYGAFSGHFILTHKKAWNDVDGFIDGWTVDNPYCESIRKAGYKRMIIKDLYMYHTHTLKGVWNNV